MIIINTGLNMNESNMQYRNTSSINALVVHHIEAEGSYWTVDFINEMHKRDNGWSGIGYHIYIRKDGTVYRGRKDCYVGAHCQGFNSSSIGIAFEGNFDKSTTVMTDAQYNAWVEVYNYYKSLYGTLPVYGHKEKSSSLCPGNYFPLSKIKNVANGIVESSYQWKQDATGYYYTDGTNYKKSCWEKIDGKWYYFLDSGYIVSNKWYKINGTWYYFDNDGVMAESKWVKTGEWYYVDENGAMIEDKWLKINNEWYIFAKGGAMKTGWVSDESKWYYMEPTSGKMISSQWVKLANEWYYLKGDGVMVIGEQTIDGNEYFFFENGIMAAGETVNNKSYGPDGKLIK